MTFTPGSKMEIECAVCLQPSIHPVRLPCNHIFCFLCVKGTILRYDIYLFHSYCKIYFEHYFFFINLTDGAIFMSLDGYGTMT